MYLPTVDNDLDEHTQGTGFRRDAKGTVGSRCRRRPRAPPAVGYIIKHVQCMLNLPVQIQVHAERVQVRGRVLV